MVLLNRVDSSTIFASLSFVACSIRFFQVEDFRSWELNKGTGSLVRALRNRLGIVLYGLLFLIFIDFSAISVFKSTRYILMLFCYFPNSGFISATDGAARFFPNSYAMA